MQQISNDAARRLTSMLVGVAVNNMAESTLTTNNWLQIGPNFFTFAAVVGLSSSAIQKIMVWAIRPDKLSNHRRFVFAFNSFQDRALPNGHNTWSHEEKKDAVAQIRRVNTQSLSGIKTS